MSGSRILLVILGIGFLGAIVRIVSVPVGNNPAETRASAIAQDIKADEALRSDKKFMSSPVGKCWSKHFDEGWTVDDCKAIASHKFRIGMTEKQVTASVGRPDHINRSVYGNFEKDQWVYGFTSLYFEDGVLTSFQSTTE